VKQARALFLAPQLMEGHQKGPVTRISSAILKKTINIIFTLRIKTFTHSSLCQQFLQFSIVF